MKRVHLISKLIAIALICIFTFMPNTSLAYNELPVLYPYQGLLNEQQMDVYNQVYEKALACDTELFKLSYPLSESEFEDTMTCFYFDHPEFFWLDTAYKYAINSSRQVVKLQFSYGISLEQLPEAKAAYEAAINDIVKGAAMYVTPLEKEKYIHDRICAMNSYNMSGPLNQSAYSALTTGATVCAGYARAFTIVCLRVGIPCYYVTGESRGQNHAWNIVYIDGKYYNVDLTWDDSLSESTGKNQYLYFNKSDEFFAIDHTRSAYSIMLTSCID